MMQNDKIYYVNAISSTIDTSLSTAEYYSSRHLVSRNIFNNQKQFTAEEYSKEAGNIQEFISDQPKFIITMEPSMYHTIVDSLGGTLYWLKKYPDVLFLIDMYFISEDPKRWHMVHGFFLEVLEKNNIQYRLINLKESSIIVNNFYIATEQDGLPNYRFKLINDEVCKFYSLENIVPYKRVYLSRKNSGSYFLWDRQELKPGAPFKDDIRIYEEELLEDYFHKLGYEIIYAENFKNFKQQSEFFREVKTLVSSTGTGLANAVFMKPGSNILELVSPMGAVFPEGYHYSTSEEDKLKPADWIFEYHNIYKDICNTLGHNYISINSNKDPRTVISFIDSRPELRALLSIW